MDVKSYPKICIDELVMPENLLKVKIQELLALADVKINGNRPWDITVQDDQFYPKVFEGGSLGLGESYMDRLWDCQQLDQMICLLILADVEHKLPWNWRLAFHWVKAYLVNQQKKRAARQKVRRHYELGNDLFSSMLDQRMVYSSANWGRASSLAEAQEAKLDFVCQKLQVARDSTILDIGCGWGSFAKFAAEKYGARVMGITLSENQAKFGRQMCADLPVEIRVLDYRDLSGIFDHVVSLGMFEHVGSKNYRTYMEIVHRRLKRGGLFYLNTIGANQTSYAVDRWINTHIFPGGMFPSIRQIGASIEGLFHVEELQNWGTYYDKTLMAWYRNFDENWGKLQSRYGERFYRMWKYYLLASAGAFRAREIQDWHVVLSRS
jgi:cyclopropane-fatty-acyl-phospholipid synthase